MTGNLLAESEVPTPDEGCVPDGRWELVVSVDDPADCGDVELRSSYTYDVHTDAESGVIDVTYLGADLDEDVYLKVTFEGGACTGNFEHYGAGGAEVLILRPYVEDQDISGRGMFERRD